MHGNRGYISCDPAKLFVVDRFRDCRPFTTNRALRVAPHVKLAEFHLQRVEMQQASDKCFADAEDQLDRFDCLHHPDDPRKDAENARLGAIRDCPWSGRLRKQTAITRTTQMRCENGGLSIEAKNGAVNIWLARKNADVVRQITRRKIIRAVHDNVAV